MVVIPRFQGKSGKIYLANAGVTHAFEFFPFQIGDGRGKSVRPSLIRHTRSHTFSTSERMAGKEDRGALPFSARRRSKTSSGSGIESDVGSVEDQNG